MKKIIISVSASTMLLVVTLFTSCTKTENSTPVITMLGANPYIVYLNSTYIDPGATATDNIDGNLTGNIVTNIGYSNPNMNQVGAYSIVYLVSDAAGNTTTVTRTVNVVNQAAFLDGNYSFTDIETGDSSSNPGTWIYYATVTSSSTINNNISIANFDNLGTSVLVTAIYNSANNTLSIPSQQPIGSGYTITGTGKTNTTNILSTTSDADSSTVANHEACTYTILSNKKK